MANETDKGVIRRVISFESDCLNEYEKMLVQAQNKAFRAIIMMLIEEKKAHIRELQIMLAEREPSGESAPQANIPEYAEDYGMVY